MNTGIRVIKTVVEGQIAIIKAVRPVTICKKGVNKKIAEFYIIAK